MINFVTTDSSSFNNGFVSFELHKQFMKTIFNVFIVLFKHILAFNKVYIYRRKNELCCYFLAALIENEALYVINSVKFFTVYSPLQ